MYNKVSRTQLNFLYIDYMNNEPYLWYNLGYEFGIFDEKLYLMKMTFLHNFGVTSYFVKLCAYIQQNLFKKLEEELTNIITKEYKTEYLPGYDIMVKDIFKINRPLKNDTTELSVITSPRKLPKYYKLLLIDSIYFMRSYIIKIYLLFFNNKNKNNTINDMIESIDKLKEIILNKRLYDNDK